MVKINGIEIECEGISLKEYLQQNNYNIKRIAIERNNCIIPKSEYDNVIIKNGDKFEIVSFVGGG